jgi:predicted permease
LSRIRIPSDLPLVLSIEVNERVLWFSLVVSLASAILFGLVPALQTSRTDLLPALKAADVDGSRKQRLWGRNALVVAQVALSLVLMVVATMLFRGFRAELISGPGFRTDHLVMMSFDPTLVRYSDAQAQQFYKELRERASATPGVKSAALTMVIPMAPNQHQESLVPEGYQLPKDRNSVTVFADTVDDHFFDTMAVPIVRGRGFRQIDRAAAPLVAVVNEALARHYWPNRDAIGKRFQLDAKGPWVEIVGVAKTGKYLWIGEAPTEFLYLPLAQHPRSRMILVAQSFGDAAGLVAPLRDMVRRLDANQPVYDVRTMTDFFQMRAISVPGMITQMTGAMGLIGLLLAMVGLYGLMAFSVTRRTREIGIRMAIGADRNSVVRMVLRQGFILALTGLALGLGASFVAEKALMAMLSSTERDPLAYLMVAPALLAVTMLAAWGPAHRASRVDPMRALRYE